VHQLYSSAFFNLSSIPEIKTLADNERLCKVMAQMVEEHRDNIPLLAKGALASLARSLGPARADSSVPTGFKESRKYLPDATITDFLDRAIRNRISLRLMAEQHLSLSAASLPFLRPAEALPSPPSSEPKDLRVEPSARPPSSSLSATYGVAPKYRIEGGSPGMTVGSIGSHLEYILTELLKNSFRATIEHNVPKPEEKDDPDEFRFEDLPHAHMLSSDFPEVLVTVSTVPGAMTIRIRDRGGGIRASSFLRGERE